GGDVERAAGLQRDVVARVTQGGEQDEAALLREGLAAGDADVVQAVAGDLVEDGGQVTRLAAIEGVFGVTPHTAQRTAGEADEDGGQAGAGGFALYGCEDLRHPQPGDGRVRAHARVSYPGAVWPIWRQRCRDTG